MKINLLSALEMIIAIAFIQIGIASIIYNIPFIPKDFSLAFIPIGIVILIANGIRYYDKTKNKTKWKASKPS